MIRILLSIMLIVTPVAVVGAQPVKIDVTALHQISPVDGSVPVEITVLNVDNRPEKAPHDIPLELVVVTPDGESRVMDTTLGAGQSDTSVTVALSQPGVYTLQAKSAQLIDGGTLIRALEPQEAPFDPMAKRDPTDSIDLDLLLTQTMDTKDLKLALRAFPDEPRLADGRDSATVYAYLIGGQTVAPFNIQIVLHNDDGTLDPNVVLIKRGDFRGHARLTSKHVGKVRVEYLNSSPELPITGEKNLEVDFRVPVVKLAAIASPARISIFERSRLMVRLMDHQGRLTADDRDRDVYLSIQEGRGLVEKTNLVVSKGTAQASALFNPTASGTVTIEARSPNLLPQTISLEIYWPVLLFIITAFGAAIGGSLAFLHKKASTWWLIPTGLVTGFILYWAVLFGLIDIMANHLILNLFSAFSIAVLGGWAGPKVIDALLKRFGIKMG